jgi:hypothetical protein
MDGFWISWAGVGNQSTYGCVSQNRKWSLALLYLSTFNTSIYFLCCHYQNNCVQWANYNKIATKSSVKNNGSTDKHFKHQLSWQPNIWPVNFSVTRSVTIGMKLLTRYFKYIRVLPLLLQCLTGFQKQTSTCLEQNVTENTHNILDQKNFIFSIAREINFIPFYYHTRVH